MTTIEYSLPESAPVTLSVYNSLGEEIATLVNGEQVAGTHSVQWLPGAIAAGCYFCELRLDKLGIVSRRVLRWFDK